MRKRLPTVVIGALLVIIGLITLSPGGGDGYQLSFVFNDAAGLRAGDEVKIDGAPAGQVEGVSLTAAHRALVRTGLNPGAGPIGTGATGEVRPTGLLGEPYIDLGIGNLARPQPSGSVIGGAMTSTAVSFSDVLSTLDAPTRARLQILIAATGTALAGHGKDLHSLLSVLPESLAQARAILDQVRQQRRGLSDLISRGDRILTAAASRRGDLGHLVDEANGVLAIVASRRAQLAATVQRAPAALGQLADTVTTLGTTAARLAPTSQLLVSAAAPLHQVLSELPGFQSQVRDVLAASLDVSPRIIAFARQAVPPLRHVSSVLAQIRALANTLRPLIDVLGGGGTDELFRFIDGSSQAMSRHDAIGSLVRIGLVLDASQLGALASARGETPRRLRTTRPGIPLPSTAATRPASTPTASSPAPPGVPASVPVQPTTTMPAGPPQSPGGALAGLLHYLLGR